MPYELTPMNVHKGGGRSKKTPPIVAHSDGEDTLPDPLEPQEKKATETTYMLDQLKGLTGDKAGFIFCMQKLQLISNGIVCGRYL